MRIQKPSALRPLPPPQAVTPSTVRTALDAPAFGSPVISHRLDGASRQPRNIGPEAAGKIGDLVQAPPINLTVGEILAAKRKLDADPARIAQLRTAPFPSSSAARLEWALAQPSGVPNLSNPLWTRGTNDNRAALVAWVQGVTTATSAGIPLSDQSEAQALAAMASVTRDLTRLNALESQPFPANAPIEQQLEWAAAMTYAWDWTSNPSVAGNPRARGLVSFVNGAIAKTSNSATTPLKSERKTLTVDGDTRVYAVHTPPGKTPKDGWPTVMFFHGSFGGYAPEQNEEYQRLNALADAQGFQIVYPVGLPQDRADSQTGRGMLNWDPVGAGPGGANDRFVHALLKELTHGADATHADRTRIFAAGHSQGGFYTSDLIAAYPGVFAGATILGAGLGSVAEGADLSAATRKTPTLLRVGVDDMHIGVGERLAGRFDAAGFGSALRFDRLAGRGHEVLDEDLSAMLGFFKGQPAFTASKAGTLDGKTGDARPRPAIFRPALQLSHLPAAITRDPLLLRAVQSLAANQALNLDANPAELSVAEWQLALAYLSTFPPDMQRSIEGLRPHFVVGLPPKGAQIDVRNVPAQLRASSAAMAALAALTQSPQLLDLDGYPGFFTAEEAGLAFDAKGQFPAMIQAGIDELRAYFFSTPTAHPVDLRPRTVETLPGGAKLESYPGSDAARAAMKRLVEGLGASPDFARLLAKTTLVVGPPGQTLEAVPEGEGLGEGVEGVASAAGFSGHGRTIAGMAFIVREDSIRQWTLGAGHELLHLLRADKGAAAQTEVSRVWEAIGGKDGQPDGYPNSEEMFAYLGQWYLAGFGAQLEQVSPQAFALCQTLIGPARIDPGALTVPDAQASLQRLMSWFRSGVH